MKYLESLNVFLAVARAKSFTQAANRLEIPKSTVSRKIKELEDELGLKLINRNQRNFELTNEGISLYQKGKIAINDIENAFNEIRSSDKGLMGKIVISCTPDLASLYLTDAIKKYSLLNPHVKIIIDATPHQAELISEGIDFGLRAGNLPDSSMFVRKLCEREIGLFATPKFLKTLNEPLQIENLHTIPFIATKPLKINNLVFEPKIKINNMSLIKDFVLKDYGIGFLDVSIAMPYLTSKKLVKVFPEQKLEKTSVNIIYPHKELPLRVKKLFDLIFLERNNY
jgi:DNA-binding transcriptional LysR family regulator